MPVRVAKRGPKFRIVEPSGKIAKGSKAAAERQARAINSGSKPKNNR